MNMHQPPDLLTLEGRISTSSAGAEISAPACKHCGQPFERHKGGQPQKFCSKSCKDTSHADKREADKATLLALEQRTTLQSSTSHPDAADADQDAPTPSQLRDMLISAGKEYDAKFPPSSIERSVDRVLADMARDGSMGSGIAIDDDAFDWSGSDSIIAREQRNTAAYFNKDGDLVIRQEAAWNDTEDSFVIVAKPNIDTFIDKLTDVLGIPAFGG